MKSYYYILLILIIFYNTINTMQEPSPSICFNNNWAAASYIGICEARLELERIYCKKFPFNTIFFKIDFKNTEQVGLKYGKSALPDYIPYNIIKNNRENSIIILKLHGAYYSFICKQKDITCNYSNSTFHELLNIGYKNFLAAPHVLEDSQESLIKNKVIIIDKGSIYAIKHGENCAPEIKLNNNF